MKIAALSLAGFLFASLSAFGQAGQGSTAADQQWLKAVQTMVMEGKTTVSTLSQDRMTLLKDWATKAGYSVQIAESEKTFRISLSKNLAKG